VGRQKVGGLLRPGGISPRMGRPQPLPLGTPQRKPEGRVRGGTLEPIGRALRVDSGAWTCPPLPPTWRWRWRETDPEKRERAGRRENAAFSWPPLPAREGREGEEEEEEIGGRGSRGLERKRSALGPLPPTSSGTGVSPLGRLLTRPLK